MRDDWNDRRQGSIDSLNRAADQSDFHRSQMEKSRAVSDGILHHDDFQVRRELGITPPVPDDDGGGSAGSAEPASVQQLFNECRANLRATFKYSEVLPAHLTQEWIARLDTIDLGKPLPGLDTHRELVRDYEAAVERARPRRDIFNLAITEEMRFEREREEVTRAFRTLSAILWQALNEAIARVLPRMRK